MKGIGIDIVSVSRLSDKVADKILSKKEMAEFNSYLKTDRERAMEFLGGRLAAKEAYLKFIGTGLKGGISSLSITPDGNKFANNKDVIIKYSNELPDAVTCVVYK